MRYPEKLNKGDTIGIICPSSPVEPGKTPALIKRMEDLGYKVKAADNIEENYGGFMAGTGKTRGEWVNRMFADPEVKAVFCVRGGDGSSRIMEYLDYDVIRNNPKIFVGYSDVTNIHLGINQNCGLVTFHGPMVSSNILNDFDDETAESLFAAINAEGDFEFKNPAGFDVKVLKEGKAEGILTPKAVVAVDLFGLPADFDAVRKVTDKYGLLVLEDGAQGFGGRIGDRRACSFGDISTTSFFPAKPLTSLHRIIKCIA